MYPTGDKASEEDKMIFSNEPGKGNVQLKIASLTAEIKQVVLSKMILEYKL